MSLIVESSPFKSPILLDVFRLLAFSKELDNIDAKNIRYVGPQASIAKSLEKYCKEN